MTELSDTAMVLAAGLGTRMRPLTQTRPKPLIEVAGRALIDHLLDRFAECGVPRAVVNVHYLAEMMEAHLTRRADVDIVVSDERTALLDSGGGVVKALPLLGRRPFFVANADVIWTNGAVPALERLRRAWDPARMDALMLLCPLAAAIGYDGPGDYFMDQRGVLTPRGEARLAPFIYAGVHILKPAAFADRTVDAVADAFSLTAVWAPIARAGRLYGIRHDGLWMHVGTPEGITLAEEALEP